MMKEVKKEDGIALLIFLLILGAGALIFTATLKYSSFSLRAVKSLQTSEKDYYEAERAISLVVNWFRANSRSLTNIYKKEEFYANFDRTTPGTGSNDLSHTVDSTLRLASTSHTPILVSDSSMGTAEFPATVDEVEGTAFDPVSAFASADFGSALVQVTLVNAIPVNPAGDTGQASPEPTTDFKPVYRIDAMTGDEKGVHLYAYLNGDINVADQLPGMFGSSGLHLGRYWWESSYGASVGENLGSGIASCDSYNSSAGPYGGANRSADCLIRQKNNTLNIWNGAIIYGKAEYQFASVTPGPIENQVCGDLSCNTTGDICDRAADPTCSSNSPIVNWGMNAWQTWCEGENKGDITINPGEIFSLPPPASNAASDRCWGTITVNNGGTLILTSTEYGYYFQRLDISTYGTNKQGVHGKVIIDPDDTDGTVNLYLWRSGPDPNNAPLDITQDAFVVTTQNPRNFKLWSLSMTQIYADDGDTYNFYGQIECYLCSISIRPNVEYFGTAWGTEVNLFRGAHFHSDGAITDAPGDTYYEVSQVTQRFR